LAQDVELKDFRDISPHLHRMRHPERRKSFHRKLLEKHYLDVVFGPLNQQVDLISTAFQDPDKISESPFNIVPAAYNDVTSQI
jgi:hypothetical protein